MFYHNVGRNADQPRAHNSNAGRTGVPQAAPPAATELDSGGSSTSDSAALLDTTEVTSFVKRPHGRYIVLFPFTGQVSTPPTRFHKHKRAKDDKENVDLLLSSRPNPEISELLFNGEIFMAYGSQEEGDVGVSRGEFVTVLNKDDPDWTFIRRAGGAEGFVPASFLCPAEGQYEGAPPNE